MPGQSQVVSISNELNCVVHVGSPDMSNADIQKLRAEIEQLRISAPLTIQLPAVNGASGAQQSGADPNAVPNLASPEVQALLPILSEFSKANLAALTPSPSP